MASIEMLGGTCVRCGATEDLEFDHIDPSIKAFAVCAGLSRAWNVLVEEASKTQLLLQVLPRCQRCRGQARVEARHLPRLLVSELPVRSLQGGERSQERRPSG